jgi:hypothetical protein
MIVTVKKEADKVVKVHLTLAHGEAPEPVMVASGYFELTQKQFLDIQERANEQAPVEGKHEYYLCMIPRKLGFWPVPDIVGLDKASGETVKEILLESVSRKKELRAQLESTKRDSRDRMGEVLRVGKG